MSYQSLMRDLAHDYDSFSDIPVLSLYEPALEWWMSRPESDAYEPVTDCPRGTYIKLWQVLGPRMMQEFVSLMHKRDNKFQDAAAKLSIEIASAVTMYALEDLSESFDYEKDVSVSDVIESDRLERARDMQRELA